MLRLCLSYALSMRGVCRCYGFQMSLLNAAQQEDDSTPSYNFVEELEGAVMEVRQAGVSGTISRRGSPVEVAHYFQISYLIGSSVYLTTHPRGYLMQQVRIVPVVHSHVSETHAWPAVLGQYLLEERECTCTQTYLRR